LKDSSPEALTGQLQPTNFFSQSFTEAAICQNRKSHLEFEPRLGRKGRPINQ